MKSCRKTTQQDVAKAAQVSQALVSLAFSSTSPGIGVSTRKHIIATARRLGYQPRAGGRPKRNKLFAYIRPVVTPSGNHDADVLEAIKEFYNGIQNCLVDAAVEAGLDLLVKASRDELQITHWLSEWDIDGVIWHSWGGTMLDWIVARFPTVQLNRCESTRTDAVCADQELIVEEAMNHLVEHGHRRIAFCPLYPPENKLWQVRTQAYREYVRSHGLPATRVYEGNLESRLELVRDVVNAAPDAPTALIAADSAAILVAKAAKEQGLELPRQLSIVGVDNISAGAHVEPALTSFDQQMPEIARCAIALLVERIKHPETPFRRIAIAPKLVPRDSVARIPCDLLVDYAANAERKDDQ